MNRCKNRRWMALVASVMMVFSLMVMPVLSLYAAEEAPTIIKIEYKKVGGTDTKTRYLYNVTVSLMGTKELIDKVAGSVIRISDCTLQQRKSDGEDPDVDDFIAIPGVINNYPPSSTEDTFKYIDIEFTNLYTRYQENTINFTIHSIDGTVTLSKNFAISSKDLIPPPSSSTPSDDDDDEEDTPISALKPHLIVDSYSYGEASAGKDVPVTFTLKNTSASKTIRNVVLTVKASGDLRIKSASDTIYVDSIQPGKTITKSMNFFLGAGTQADVQDIAISSTFEYFDIEGQNAVSGGDSITISIPTDTVERVRIQKVDLPDMLYPGTEEEIAYSVVNAGFSTLYNCEIKVVDEEGTEYAYAYVGSLEPSKAASQPYLPIMFDVSGEKNLKFVLTYENEKLQAGEVTRDFAVSVMEMPVYEEPPMEPFPEEPMPEEPQGMAPWLLWVIIGGGVLVTVIVTVVVIKAVKKKRSELDDEDI